jgi:hypothetical protein
MRRRTSKSERGCVLNRGARPHRLDPRWFSPRCFYQSLTFASLYTRTAPTGLRDGSRYERPPRFPKLADASRSNTLPHPASPCLTLPHPASPSLTRYATLQDKSPGSRRRPDSSQTRGRARTRSPTSCSCPAARASSRSTKSSPRNHTCWCGVTIWTKRGHCNTVEMSSET